MPWERIKTRNGTRLRPAGSSGWATTREKAVDSPDTDAPDEAPANRDMTKAELLAQADERGIIVSAHATKAEIVEALDG